MGATTLFGQPIQFEYRGYKIPLDLAEMTGAGVETWEEVGFAHLDYYDMWAPIGRDDSVLEIGCGIGRDATLLAGLLSSRGSYVGIDITHYLQEIARVIRGDATVMASFFVIDDDTLESAAVQAGPLTSSMKLTLTVASTMSPIRRQLSPIRLIGSIRWPPTAVCECTRSTVASGAERTAVCRTAKTCWSLHRPESRRTPNSRAGSARPATAPSRALRRGAPP